MYSPQESNIFSRRITFVNPLGRKGGGNVTSFALMMLLNTLLTKCFANRNRTVEQRKSRILTKISIFGENLEFWRKSRLLAKISTFGENLDIWWKSRPSAKISTFGENLDFWRKSRLLVKISTFGENLDFWRKLSPPSSIYLINFSQPLARVAQDMPRTHQNRIQ